MHHGVHESCLTIRLFELYFLTLALRNSIAETSDVLDGMWNIVLLVNSCENVRIRPRSVDSDVFASVSLKLKRVPGWKPVIVVVEVLCSEVLALTVAVDIFEVARTVLVSKSGIRKAIHAFHCIVDSQNIVTTALEFGTCIKNMFLLT